MSTNPKKKYPQIHKEEQLSHFSFFKCKETYGFQGDHHKWSFTCRITGLPKAQERCFATTRGTRNKVHMVNMSQYFSESFENAFRQALQNAPTNFFKHEGFPIALKIRFIFPRPKHHYVYQSTSGSLLLSSSAPFFVTKVPDLDNLLKLVLDAVQGVCYKNDCVVCHIDSCKVWDNSQQVYQEGQHKIGYTIMKVTEIQPGSFLPDCDCLSCKHKRGA